MSVKYFTSVTLRALGVDIFQAFCVYLLSLLEALDNAREGNKGVDGFHLAGRKASPSSKRPALRAPWQSQSVSYGPEVPDQTGVRWRHQ